MDEKYNIKKEDLPIKLSDWEYSIYFDYKVEYKVEQNYHYVSSGCAFDCEHIFDSVFECLSVVSQNGTPKVDFVFVRVLNY